MCKLRGRCGGTRDDRREVTCEPGPGRATTFSSRRLHHHEVLPSNTPTPQPSTHATVRRPLLSFLCAATPSGRSSYSCAPPPRSIAAVAAPQPSLRPTPVHGPQPQWTTPEIPALGLRCPTLVAHSVWEYVAPGSPSAGRPAPCEKMTSMLTRLSPTGDRRRRYDSDKSHFILHFRSTQLKHPTPLRHVALRRIVPQSSPR